MGSKKIFLKVSVLVHFREIVFSLRRNPVFLMAENRSPKMAKKGKGGRIWKAANMGYFR